MYLIAATLGMCGLVAWVTGRHSRPRQHDWLGAELAPDLSVVAEIEPFAAPVLTRLFGDAIVFGGGASGVAAGGRKIELFDFRPAPGAALLTGATVVLHEPWPDLHVESGEGSLHVARGFAPTADAFDLGSTTVWSPDPVAAQKRIDGDIGAMLNDLAEAVSITISGDRLLLWGPALPSFVLAALPAILDRCLGVLEQHQTPRHEPTVEPAHR